ncbi:MAG: O-antigen ligase family protein [Geminicoccaceae bacterium]
MDLHLHLGTYGWPFGLALIALVIGLGLRWPILLLLVALLSLAVRPKLLVADPSINGWDRVIGWEWGLHHTLMVLGLVACARRFGLKRSIPWPMAALLLTAALSALFGNPDPNLTPRLMVESLAILCLPFAFTQIDFPILARRICAPAIMALPSLSVVLGALIQIAGLHVGFAGLHDRLEGATGNAGVFGILAFAGLAVALHETARQQRPWAILPTAINLALIVFSGSRTAILASGLLLIAYLLASSRFREQLRRHARAALACLVLAGATTVAYLPKLFERLHMKMDRLELWQVFYDDFLKSPLFGRGVGAGFVADVDWPADVEKPVLAVPHNEYLHLLVNGGAVGFLLCAAAIAYWYGRLIRSAADEDQPFLMALLPAMAVFALTENFLIHAVALALYVYLGLVARVADAVDRDRQEPMEKKDEETWPHGGNARPRPGSSP